MKTIVIAEAGVNHNGSLKIAKKLIDVASKSGATYVKFQFYRTENLIRNNTEAANYQKKNYGKKISQFELLKKYEFNYNHFKSLLEHSKKKKIKFLCSVFDEESFNNLIKLKIYDIKIPSGEINNTPLLKKISKYAKKVFLSTGMSTIKEIAHAVKVFKNIKKKNNLFVMHCHTDYPTKIKDVNLLFMPELAKKFKVHVGYSDHTIFNDSVSIAAVALGAKVIEKHFTLSRKLKGPDHKASVEPKELKNFISNLKNTEILLGSKKKIITPIEVANKFFVRKSIVAKRFIKKGENFSKKNLTCKRPESGIYPIFWNDVIGKKANKDFQKDENISL